MIDNGTAPVPVLPPAPPKPPEYTFDDFRNSGDLLPISLQLLPHLLRTVQFLFNSTHAQVTPMILHATANDDELVIRHIIALQRLFCWATYKTFDTLNQTSLTFRILPHKLYRRQGREVRHRKATRTALEIRAGSEPSKREMYAYLGGGVEWDPPNGFSLVFKEVPLDVAEHLTAVLLFFANVQEVDPCLIAMRPPMNPQKVIGEAEEDQKKQE